VKGEWRRLHNVELNDLYSSPNIIRVIKSRRRRWAEHVAHVGERRCACRVLVRKPEGIRPFGRLRSRLGFRELVRAPVKTVFRPVQQGRSG